MSTALLLDLVNNQGAIAMPTALHFDFFKDRGGQSSCQRPTPWYDLATERAIAMSAALHLDLVNDQGAIEMSTALHFSSPTEGGNRHANGPAPGMILRPRKQSQCQMSSTSSWSTTKGQSQCQRPSTLISSTTEGGNRLASGPPPWFDLATKGGNRNLSGPPL